MVVVSLVAGDELVIGPAVGAATVKYEVTFASGQVNVEVRDAIEYRDQVIKRLRAQIADLKAERSASTDEIVDAVIERLRGALGSS